MKSSLNQMWLSMFLAAAALPALASEAQVPDARFSIYHQQVDEEFQKMLRNLDPPAASAVAPAIPKASPDVAPIAQTPAHARPSLEQMIGSFAARFWNGRVADLREALWRMSRIRPAIERILAEEGVPVRFAAIVLVESGANPVALSPKSARGLWQLVPDTARRYGLVVSQRRDDRIDLAPATRAAAAYLRDLHHEFGDWKLALAAYNAGEGSIRSALARTRIASFPVLSDRRLIPAETSKYVPAVLAAVNLLNADSPAWRTLPRSVGNVAEPGKDRAQPDGPSQLPGEFAAAIAPPR